MSTTRRVNSVTSASKIRIVLDAVYLQLNLIAESGTILDFLPLEPLLTRHCFDRL